MIILIRSYMSFILGNSTIRYICYTQHLNIMCIIFYFNIFPFFKHYLHYNIYAIILISLHLNSGPSRYLFFDIYNNFFVLTPDKPRLFTVVIWLHRILRQQYGRTLGLLDLPTKRWAQFIDIHTTAIVFIASKTYSGHNKFIVYYIPTLH